MLSDSVFIEDDIENSNINGSFRSEVIPCAIPAHPVTFISSPPPLPPHPVIMPFSSPSPPLPPMPPCPVLLGIPSSFSNQPPPPPQLPLITIEPLQAISCITFASFPPPPSPPPLPFSAAITAPPHPAIRCGLPSPPGPPPPPHGGLGTDSFFKNLSKVNVFFNYLCHFTFMSRNDNSACFTSSVRTVFFCCCVQYKLFFELISS